jgi:hypothetical protein
MAACAAHLMVLVAGAELAALGKRLPLLRHARVLDVQMLPVCLVRVRVHGRTMPFDDFWVGFMLDVVVRVTATQSFVAWQEVSVTLA